MALIPTKITAGLTLVISFELAAFSGPQWQSLLLLRGAGSIDLEGSADGQLHLITGSVANTGSWAPGHYSYSLRVTDGTDTHEIEAGMLEVRPDLAQAAASFDGRAHAEKVLSSIEAVIEGRATRDQDSYRINNRELRRTPISQLLKLRDVYRHEVAQIKARRRGKDTLGRAILVRFGHGV
jgi:hypothetical protein